MSENNLKEMITKQQIKTFMCFLRKNNIYMEFWVNVLHSYQFVYRFESNASFQEYINSKKSLFNILNKTRTPISFLENSFLWEGSNQGFDFWDKANKKWIEYYYSH